MKQKFISLITLLISKINQLAVLPAIILCGVFTPFANAQTVSDADPLFYLEYIASYPDLMNSIGANPDAGKYHFDNSGTAEGRVVSFDSCNYLASNPDLMNWLNLNYVGAAKHYIEYGRFENRSMSFDSNQYMLANPDVLQTSNADSDAACVHYIKYGRFDGHLTVPGKKLVGLGNKCLTAGGNTPVQGSQVSLWDCVGDVPQQQWKLNSNGLVVGIGGNCLTPNNWVLENGSSLIMWPCDSKQDSQRWSLNADGNLINSNDTSKCVDIAGMNTANGTTAWVWDCWGGSNQLWSPAAGLNLVGLAGKCLDAGTATAGNALNSRATLYSCNQAPQQQWVFDRGLVKGLGGLCLTMQNSKVYSGAPLVMSSCLDDSGPTGQHWYMKTDTTIASSDNASLCINVLGGNSADGAPVSAYTCTAGAANNFWRQL